MNRCCKCAGFGTRAHHRRCENRGAGHLGRGARVRWTQARAAEWNLSLRIRLGRGPGMSLPAARAHLLRTINGFPRSTAGDVQSLVAFALGCKPERVKVSRGMPGQVLVKVPLDVPVDALVVAERTLFEALPADMAFVVEREAMAPVQQTTAPESTKGAR